LDLWKAALRGEQRLDAPEQSICDTLLDLVNRRGVNPGHYYEIIAGVEMDIHPQPFADWPALRLYCHRVASVVGLVSIQIFGCTSAESVDYALNLGLAFQVTNIIRDVGRDYANEQRIYLPQDEMRQFGCEASQWTTGDGGKPLRELLGHQAARAREYYRSALAHFTRQDARPLMAAEIMRGVYGTLLNRMERAGFPVLHQRHSLSKPEKLGIIASTWLWVRLNKPGPVRV